MPKKLNLEMIPSNYDVSTDIIKEDLIMNEKYEEENEDAYDEYYDSENDMEMDYGYLEDEEDEDSYFESILY